jgi:hypothetical protein
VAAATHRRSVTESNAVALYTVDVSHPPHTLSSSRARQFRQIKTTFMKRWSKTDLMTSLSFNRATALCVAGP